MSDIGGDWEGAYSYGGHQRDFPAMHFGATFTVADMANMADMADGRTADGTWQIRRRVCGLILRRSEGVWHMQRPDLPPMQTVWPPAPQEPPQEPR